MLTTARRRSSTTHPRFRMTELNSAPTQLRVIFHGHVQGVGFRYRTNAIAQRYPVSGSVKNLPDGTVELLVAGPQAVVGRFLADVDSAMSDNIQRKDVAEFAGIIDHAGFAIRR